MTVLSIANTLKIVPTLPISVSVLFRGNHGIGKSALVRQFAEMWGLDVIDRRLSQMTGGDLIGLPKLEDGMTRFMPPDWFMSACKEPKVIFLDELNRATDDVIQGAFQIALDRECNGHKLHPETRVFSAINLDSRYNVRIIDPALLDRFYVIDINFRPEDWLVWAKKAGIHRSVVSFIQNDPEALTAKGDYDVQTKVPSPRSWATFATACKDMLEPKEGGKYDFETVRLVCQGFVGHDAALSFVAHLKSVRNVTGKEILDGWRSKELRKEPSINLEDNAFMMGCLDKLADECRTWYTVGQKTKEKPLNEKLKKEHGENLEQFMFDLPNEARPVFWQKLVQGITNVEDMRFIIDANRWLAPAICAAFGIQVGKAGVGQMPKASFRLDSEIAQSLKIAEGSIEEAEDVKSSKPIVNKKKKQE